MTFDPLASTGMIVVPTADGWAIGGSCFVFRRPSVVLTASHCLPHGVICGVAFPQTQQRRQIDHVVRHPTADLCAAVLRDEVADPPEWPEPFGNTVTNWGLGEQVYAHGFPTEGPTFEAANVPVARLFTGHFQRFFRHQSPSGYEYLAGELSFPAPLGLSGGPVFRPAAVSVVLGVVTANVESYTITDSVEEVDEAGRVLLRVEGRRVLSYGIVLMLSDVLTWLDEVVPLA